MGNYLNPGNAGFAGIRNDVYVDKSGLIGLINQTIDTPRRLTCISRPRRFGTRPVIRQSFLTIWRLRATGITGTTGTGTM